MPVLRAEVLNLSTAGGRPLCGGMEGGGGVGGWLGMLSVATSTTKGSFLEHFRGWGAEEVFGFSTFSHLGTTLPH